MRFLELFDSHVAPSFIGSEAEKAITEFKNRIPGRVLQVEFDVSKSNKQGFKDGERLYKLGFDKEDSVVFIQYYDNFNQGQPTMAISVNRAKSTVTVNGWQVGRQMAIGFSVVDGVVKKSVKLS